MIPILRLVAPVLLAAAQPAVAAADDAAAQLKAIADRYGERQAERDVHAQLSLGRGVRRIPTLSLADLEAEAGFARELLRELDVVPLQSLGTEERLTAEALRWLLNDAQTLPQTYLFGFPAPYSLTELGPIGTALASNPLKSSEDRKAYLSLLASVAARFEAMRVRVRDQEARGIRMTRRQIPRGLAALQGLRAQVDGWGAVADSRLAGLAPEDRAAFRSLAKEGAARILPAIDALVASFDDRYQAQAPDTVGLWQYPGGLDHYRLLARRSTTMDIEPAALRDLGQRLLDENNRELDALSARLQVPGGRAGLRSYANGNPRFLARTPEAVMERYRVCLAGIEPKLPQFFSRMPKAPYRARRLDPAKEAGLTFGFYQQPTPAEPYGEYHFNGSKLESRSQIPACALIFHELVPGHHFHLALQTENEALPAFRRTGGFTAFNEGWAEYASNLAREMGALNDPIDLLGRLMNNSFIFSRLVVDVGLNQDAWPIDRARAFMRANTFSSDEEIESELLRYSSDIPAQALAYGAGYAAIADLRREIETATGRGFDIRRFHDEVVGHGALPMDVLRAHVRRSLTGSVEHPAR